MESIKNVLPESKKNINNLSESASKGAAALHRNIETIAKLEETAVLKRSVAEHVADKVTKFAGSTPFILLHILWFGGWIMLNTHPLFGFKPFDPYPFSFLTLVVSLEAIFLTLLVLMSQNRMTKEADKRAHLDLQINMLDEQETTIILRMVQKIALHLGMKDAVEQSAAEFCEETDITNVAKALEDNAFIQ